MRKALALFIDAGVLEWTGQRTPNQHHQPLPTQSRTAQHSTGGPSPKMLFDGQQPDRGHRVQQGCVQIKSDHQLSAVAAKQGDSTSTLRTWPARRHRSITPVIGLVLRSAEPAQSISTAWQSGGYSARLTPVDFRRNIAAAGTISAPRFAPACRVCGFGILVAEARVDAHQQHHVDLSITLLELSSEVAGLNTQDRLWHTFTNQLQRPVDMSLASEKGNKEAPASRNHTIMRVKPA